MKSPEVIVIGDGRMVPPKIGLRLATVEFRLRLEHRKKKKTRTDDPYIETTGTKTARHEGAQPGQVTARRT